MKLMWPYKQRPSEKSTGLSDDEIQKRIANSPRQRGRFRAETADPDARYCFVLFDQASLRDNAGALASRFPNSVFAVLGTGWKVEDEDAELDGARIIGLKSALQLPDYQIVAYADTQPNSHNVQRLSNLIHFGGRTVFDISCDFLPSDQLQAAPNFLRENRERISAIVNSLADEASVTCYLARLKSILLGDPGFNVMSPYWQYCHPSAAPSTGDTVIDAGIGTDAGTSFFFNRAVGDDGKVVSFEPIPEMADTARVLLSDLENVVVETKGLWNKADRVTFNIAGNVSTFRDMDGLHSDGQVDCELVSLDDYCGTSIVPNLIKMDIEGAEYSALQGAEALIRAHKPKLHVCLYHSLQDYLRIPELIRTYRPDYKIHVGHHTPFMFECVMYAA